jgi:thiol-disulfide isomerase/thioredoxin
MKWLVALVVAVAGTAAAATADPWIEGGATEPRVVLYYFWSPTCPHCKAARPFVDELARENAWIALKDLEVIGNVDNRRLYASLAARIGRQPRSVPAFLYCGEMITGFDQADGIGAFLTERLTECRNRLLLGLDAAAAQPPPAPVTVPFLGKVDVDEWSLPALTLVLAALDSFNPCAMFVLLFLLTLLVHARNRARMLLVGSTFVVVSGVVYFLFMAAWLNLFLIAGQIAWITLAAGLLAVVIALFNIKDYFWSGRGASLSIPASRRADLFQRMRGLVGADRLAPLMGGTLILALVANAYELLCTAGFPMVFTRALTLNSLPTSSYYTYLVAYNVIYVIPLLLIVVLFVFSLGNRKLSESEGRTLKLVSGLMMLGLGIVLILAPDLLGNVLVALGLVAAAIAGTAIIRWLSPTPRS